MKTMSINTRKIERMIIALFIALFGSINLHSQFSFNDKEFLSINDDRILESKEAIIKVFHHLPMAELNFMEESLNLEDWMLEPSEWLTKNEMTFHNEMFVETDLSFESWMFDAQWLSSVLVIEEELKYESWMLSPLTWN